MNKKIKITLLGILTFGSTLAITLPIVSCSSANQNLLTLDYVEGQNRDKLEKELTEIFRSLLDAKMTVEEKKFFIKSWEKDSVVPTEIKDKIFSSIIFRDINTNIIPIDKVIDKIIFPSENNPPEEGKPIDGPVIRVILNKNYITSSVIDIKIDELGLLEDTTFFA